MFVLYLYKKKLILTRSNERHFSFQLNNFKFQHLALLMLEKCLNSIFAGDGCCGDTKPRELGHTGQPEVSIPGSSERLCKRYQEP